MNENDPMCPASLAQIEHRVDICRCEEYARVRADERGRIVAELEGPAQESEAMYAHAEAVAAQLVEVICEQEYGLQQWHRATADVTYSLAQERDAARAEVEALQARLDALHAHCNLSTTEDARAEVSRLNIEVGKVVGRRDERALIVKQIIDVAKMLEATPKPAHFTDDQYDGYISGVWDTIVRIS